MMNHAYLQRIEQNVPYELKRLKVWVGFEFIPQEGKKPKKEPMNALTNGKAQSNNPGTWHSFADVMTKALRFDAIGIGLKAPYVGIDLDHSVVDGVIQPWARKIIDSFNSYTEFSPTKTGVHILCKGSLPAGRKFGTLDIEIYQTTRFLTVTGDIVVGCNVIIEDRHCEVTSLFKEWDLKDKEYARRRKSKANSLPAGRQARAFGDLRMAVGHNIDA